MDPRFFFGGGGPKMLWKNVCFLTSNHSIYKDIKLKQDLMLLKNKGVIKNNTDVICKPK